MVELTTTGVRFLVSFKMDAEFNDRDGYSCGAIMSATPALINASTIIHPLIDDVKCSIDRQLLSIIQKRDLYLTKIVRVDVLAEICTR